MIFKIWNLILLPRNIQRDTFFKGTAHRVKLYQFDTGFEGYSDKKKNYLNFKRINDMIFDTNRSLSVIHSTHKCTLWHTKIGYIVFIGKILWWWMLKFNEKKPSIKTFLPKYESTMSIKSSEAKRKPSKAVTS